MCLYPKTADETTCEISDIPLFSYQTCPTNISCPVHIAVHTVQRVPSICCTSLNSQRSLVQQLHCSDAKLADHMSFNSFCAHWGKKKDALEHCNHAESTTEGRRVSSLPSSRWETQYSVYSVTTAFFFQLLLNAEARWHWFRACVPVVCFSVN